MPEGKTEKGAEVRVIPPLVYALPFASAGLLQRFRAWGMPAFPDAGLRA